MTEMRWLAGITESMDMRWLAGITDSMDMGLSRFPEMVKDREAWHTQSWGLSQTQLSN